MMFKKLVLKLFSKWIKEEIDTAVKDTIKRNTELRDIRKSQKIEYHLDGLIDQAVVIFHNSYRLIRAGVLISYEKHDGNYICTVQEFKTGTVFSTNQMPAYASPSIIKALIKLTPEEAYSFYIGCNQPIKPVHKGNFNEVLWYNHLHNTLNAVSKFIEKHNQR